MSIEALKTLRKKTMKRVGLADCRKALDASGNDVKGAMDWLIDAGLLAGPAKGSEKTDRLWYHSTRMRAYMLREVGLSNLELAWSDEAIAKIDNGLKQIENGRGISAGGPLQNLGMTDLIMMLNLLGIIVVRSRRDETGKIEVVNLFSEFEYWSWPETCLYLAVDPSIGVIERPPGYGFEAATPIPVDAVVGELTFLKMLRCPCGEPFYFHRKGSRMGTVWMNPVDHYQLTCRAEKHSYSLFLNMYHPGVLPLPPEGLSMDYIAGEGTHLFVRDFDSLDFDGMAEKLEAERPSG